MLQFFRRYQKILFIFTTTTVVISFVFFGTYQAIDPMLSRSKNRGPVAFVTANQRKVSQGYFDSICRFLATEPELSYDAQKILSGNPLNSGIISANFLQTEIGYLLITPHTSLHGQGLQERFEMESSFAPFKHALRPHLSAQKVWHDFAPDVAQSLASFQAASVENLKENFLLRSRLYLAQRNFPASLLKQMLCYQDYQQAGVSGVDRTLAQKDYSLFGYKNLSDWFGTEFVEHCAKVIIYGAELAKSQGYKVSRQEVMTELYTKSQKCYQMVRDKIDLPTADPATFLQMLVRQQEMDQEELITICEDVLYFQKLFEGAEADVMIDSLALENFYEYANQSVTVQVTQLPNFLRFKNMKQLEEFELYLTSVCNREDDVLAIPKEFASKDVIASRAPELIGRRYVLDVAHVNKEQLYSKVSLKRLWQWQSDNAELIASAFPNVKKLEEAPELIKKSVDQFCYEKICAEHPEWIHELLVSKPHAQQELFLRFEQNKCVLAGIEDVAQLRTLLDREDALELYTQDQQNYYSIRVLARMPSGEVLSFDAAKKEGVLDELFKRKEMKTTMQHLRSALLRQLSKQGIALDLSSEEKKDQALVAYRFFPYLLRAQADESYAQGFSDAYSLKSCYKSVARSGRSFIGYEQAVQLADNPSDLMHDHQEGLYFYTFCKKNQISQLPLDKVLGMDRLVADERRGHLLEQLVKQMHHN